MSRRVVGYSYNADLYCPEHVEENLPVHKGGAFDGWSQSVPAVMPTEDSLDEIAFAFGFDREDETTFDSGEFPKRVYEDQASEESECADCGALLIEGEES